MTGSGSACSPGEEHRTLIGAQSTPHPSTSSDSPAMLTNFALSHHYFLPHSPSISTLEAISAIPHLTGFPAPQPIPLFPAPSSWYFSEWSCSIWLRWFFTE